ncbi:CARDB domain-containing protein [Halorientalis persicus]|nr:CARDB domain-containing protein [Halorientalis persicus]
MGMVAVQPAAATGVSTQTTDEAEFGNVTAEVTKETLFTGKVSKVEVTYTAPEGETVDITVADETETVTADGTESHVTLRVGAFFFFGEHYPVDVSASIEGGETVDGTINADDGVVTLKSVGGEPEPEPEPANFDVGTPSSNSPVVEGETLTVDATVENTGESAGTQTVELNVAGSVQDSTDVSLDAGTSETVSLSWTTTEGDAADYTATVSSANDSASTDVTVTAPATPADFQVSNLNAPAEATVGSTISVSADVTNEGGQEDTQSVAFGIDTDDDGELEEITAQDETLASGASTTVTFDVDTSDLAAGTYTHGVSTQNDTDTAQITLNAPQQAPNFQVSNLDAPAEATVGDTISVSADVENVGDGDDTQSVAFGIDTDDDGELEEITAQDETLASGASTTVTFDVDTSDLAAGTYTHGVSTQNDTDTAQISLNAPVVDGTIEGTVTDQSDSAIEGATVSAGGQSTTTAADGSYSLTVEEGDYTVEVTADGYQSDNATVSVTAGETTTQDFSLSETGPTYQSFTAYAESGYLQVGTNNLRSPLPDCPNGVPENESKGCVKFTADYDPETGDYTVSPENFEFPPIPFDDTTLGTVPANNTLQGTITGNLNAETGEASFNAPIFSFLEDPALDDSCGLEVNVEGTTGTSGNLTGSPGPVQDDGTARSTLVDGTFSIPAATQETCGFLATAVNNDVGLPAGAGENEIVQNLYIEFSEETVENNPDAPSNSGS